MNRQDAPSHFFAYLARMKYIQRWGLMRNTQTENVQEHSLQVAMIAHALAVIGNRLHGENNDTGHIACLALYHDASEILTGDLPTPVKYHNESMRGAYKAIERQAEHTLLGLLPEVLREDFIPLLDSERMDARAKRYIKAADSIAGYLKCVEEERAGNQEFTRARRYLANKIEEFDDIPAVTDFMRLFVQSFELTLDDLSHAPGG
ncbi:MAG: 5'-deoxynucleotidase [Halothiobacillaceae bacterium]|nr:5'-deoxynucleotidase [Halothiobacillaceae bacterium]